MSKILTLDLGTTYFKAALFDQEGTLVSLSRIPMPVTHPQPDRWEMGANEFTAAIESLCKELSASQPEGLDDVAAISFATQANSFLLLEQADRPLTPFLLWPDERAKRFEESLHEISELDDYYATTGIPKLSSQFIPAKLLWLREEEPALWKQAKKVCLLSDYLTLWMTGEHVTEAATAGLSGLIDIHQLRWWPEACRPIELPAEWLPKVVRAGSDLGILRASIARKLGLPSFCRFVVGCLDQFAGAIGAGNVASGSVSETTGTVLATVRCTNTFENLESNNIFQGPGFTDGCYYQMVFGSVSANLLEAYRNHLPDKPEFTDLGRAASKIAPGAEGLRLQPDANPQEPGNLFVEKTPAHDRGRETRAIMEAVAFALSGQVEQLCRENQPPEIRSVGGAARSELWRQIKADVLNCPIVAISCNEPTSLGAALLAKATIQEGGLGELCTDWVRTLPPNHPDPLTHALYRKQKIAARFL